MPGRPAFPRTSWSLALLLTLLIARTPAAQSGADTREFRYLMGTSMQVQAIGGDEAARRAAIDEAFAAMAEVDRLMSNYRSDSELSHLNREAARGPVVVSDPLLRVIEAGQRVSADEQRRVRRDGRPARPAVGVSRPRRRTSHRLPNWPPCDRSSTIAT